MAEVIITSGKRKSAIARAYIKKGKGIVRVNNLNLQAYPEYLRNIMAEPLNLAEKYSKKVSIEVNVKGGGPISQAEAVRTAIGKAIAKFSDDEEIKNLFMEYDRTLLVSDTRRKEPKKQLGRGARKKRQKSYR
ncbi:MAG TPA: 30S ribosomal protein S9 [Thermoplasmatales archaeon]|nr:30S ribosomal protein S9 [Thermoplasmatales archaeon]HEC88743.1 30S ribosomal protein S9 [Thermoplasmata archaeon]